MFPCCWKCIPAAFRMGRKLKIWILDCPAAVVDILEKQQNKEKENDNCNYWYDWNWNHDGNKL